MKIFRLRSPIPKPGILIVLLSVLAAHAVGHAILTEAIPAAGSKITGPDVTILLHFNARIDHQRSRLFLVLPGGAQKQLPLRPDQRADVLSGEAKGLSAGSYKLRWQVLANDGHITRGEVPFFVLAP
jgi:copper resistance protein C